MDGKMDVRVQGGGRVNGWMDGWRDGLMDGWMMGEGMVDGWMDWSSFFYLQKSSDSAPPT